MMPIMAVVADTFMPAWWCRGPHAQTIWASFLKPVPPTTSVQRKRWETPDGDFLDIDEAAADGPNQPVLVILHGLEGSSESLWIRGLIGGAHRLGWRVLAVNFRSCSGEINRLRRSYHGGETSDLAWILSQIAGGQNHSRIGCIGISLGGNVLLKYLGESAQIPGVKAAVTVSAPFDLAASAQTFEHGFINKQVYMRRLVQSLKQKTQAKLSRYPDLVDNTKLAQVRTIAAFDDWVTAPVHGFADAQAYWRVSSCNRFLAGIKTPTLLINSADDPLVPENTLPRQLVAEHPYLTAAFTRAGGHVGFIGGPSPYQPHFWAQRQAIAFLQERLCDKTTPRVSSSQR